MMMNTLDEWLIVWEDLQFTDLAQEELLPEDPLSKKEKTMKVKQTSMKGTKGKQSRNANNVSRGMLLRCSSNVVAMLLKC